MTELQDFIDNMRATSSSTDKIAIISRSSTFIHKILEYTYNPFKQYYTTSKTCKKNSDKCYYDDGDLYPFELLDSLSDNYIGKDLLDYTPTQSSVRNALLEYAAKQEFKPKENEPKRLKGESHQKWLTRWKAWNKSN